MFIGGLSWQTSAEGLREYFSKHGDVTEVMVMKDPTTRRSRLKKKIYSSLQIYFFFSMFYMYVYIYNLKKKFI